MGVDILAYKEKVAPNLILVYSAGKVGKTTTIATLIGEENRDAKIYLVDVDHGLESLWDKWVARGNPLEGSTVPNIDLKVVNNLAGFHKAVWHMPVEGYDFYVIDTITRAAKHGIKDLQPNLEPGKRERRVNMDIAFLLEDYIDRIEELCWEIKQKNPRAWVIVFCHEKEEPIPDNREEKRVVPVLWGSAGAKINRIANGVWHLEQRLVQTPDPNVFKTGRVFRTRMDKEGLIICNDRTNALKEMEPANFYKCFEKIEAFRKELPNGVFQPEQPEPADGCEGRGSDNDPPGDADAAGGSTDPADGGASSEVTTLKDLVGEEPGVGGSSEPPKE
jgi:hypothetical protein